jgi:hypothetical protein
MTNKNERPKHWMPRKGDHVDYHSIIGGEITSTHTVESVGTDAAGQAVAWITDKSGYVSCDALTPVTILPSPAAAEETPTSSPPPSVTERIVWAEGIVCPFPNQEKELPIGAKPFLRDPMVDDLADSALRDPQFTVGCPGCGRRPDGKKSWIELARLYDEIADSPSVNTHDPQLSSGASRRASFCYEMAMQELWFDEEYDSEPDDRCAPSDPRGGGDESS